MSENRFGKNIRTYRDVIVRDSEIGDNVCVGDDAFIVSSKIAEQVTIERRVMMFNSEIGSITTIGWNSVIRNAKIGKYCSIAWNCSIGGAEHALHRLSTSFFPLEKRYGIIEQDICETVSPYAAPLIIGNDVWIAAGAQILRGVCVGHGVVVGGGAVITKDIPPYEIWAGVPGKKIGQRFSDEIISDLLQLKWWDFPEGMIKQHIALFQKDIDAEVISELRQICNANKNRTHCKGE